MGFAVGRRFLLPRQRALLLCCAPGRLEEGAAVFLGLWAGLGLVLAQPTDEVTRVRSELTALHAELNRARRSRDRAALERIYAPEFRWVHGAGYAEDRTQLIDRIFQAGSSEDLPPPDFAHPNELLLAGDVAVLRRPAFVALGGERLYSTHVFVRRHGRWQMLQLQGTLLLPERQWITLPATALDAFAGRYRYLGGRSGGAVTTLTRDGDALERRTPGFPHRRLRPVAADRFYDDIGTEHVFERDAAGRVTGFTQRFVGGREGRAERVE
jgi:hypothetical protein